MLIIQLLEEKHGNLTDYAKVLGRTPWNTWSDIRGVKKDSTKKRYTKAFNECFGTNYTFNELFDDRSNDSI